MRCISPLTIRRPTGFDTVPCGKCNFCLETRRNEWTFRLTQEQKKASSSHFITLTYSPENLPTDLGLVKEHLQKFMKRLRKVNTQKVRFYAVGEYGTETQRPHYHVIMFNLDEQLVPQLQSIWGHGFAYFGTVEIGAIHYVTKYHVNRFGEYHGRPPPFCHMSRNPGIGKNYIDTHTQWHRADFRNYAQVNGIISRLPRYYKEKIFTEKERAALAEISLLSGEIASTDALLKCRAFHSDPYRYYDERMRQAHDAIVHKCNTQNTF